MCTLLTQTFCLMCHTQELRLYNNNIGDAAMKTIEGAGFRPTWNDLKIDLSKEFTYNAQNPKKKLNIEA